MPCFTKFISRSLENFTRDQDLEPICVPALELVTYRDPFYSELMEINGNLQLTHTYTSPPVHMLEEDCSSLDIENGSLELNGNVDQDLAGVGMWTQSEEGDHNDHEDIIIELRRSEDPNIVISNALDLEMDEEYCQDQSGPDLSTPSSSAIPDVENSEWETPVPQIHDSQRSGQFPFKRWDISVDAVVESECFEDDVGEERSDKLCA